MTWHRREGVNKSRGLLISQKHINKQGNTTQCTDLLQAILYHCTQSSLTGIYAYMQLSHISYRISRWSLHTSIWPAIRSAQYVPQAMTCFQNYINNKPSISSMLWWMCAKHGGSGQNGTHWADDIFQIYLIKSVLILFNFHRNLIPGAQLTMNIGSIFAPNRRQANTSTGLHRWDCTENILQCPPINDPKEATK